MDIGSHSTHRQNSLSNPVVLDSAPPSSNYDNIHHAQPGLDIPPNIHSLLDGHFESHRHDNPDDRPGDNLEEDLERPVPDRRDSSELIQQLNTDKVCVK